MQICVYCHDNEHSRYIDGSIGSLTGPAPAAAASSNPFANLKSLLKRE